MTSGATILGCPILRRLTLLIAGSCTLAHAARRLALARYLATACRLAHLAMARHQAVARQAVRPLVTRRRAPEPRGAALRAATRLPRGARGAAAPRRRLRWRRRQGVHLDRSRRRLRATIGGALRVPLRAATLGLGAHHGGKSLDGAGTWRRPPVSLIKGLLG